MVQIIDFNLTLPRIDGHPKEFVLSDRGGVSMVERKRNRYFSDEFKHDAVQLIIEKGMSVRKVALDLDIHPNLLHQWRRRYLADGSDAVVGKGYLKPQEAELKRLQMELDEVKEERDIFKKALGVLSKRSR